MDKAEAIYLLHNLRAFDKDNSDDEAIDFAIEAFNEAIDLAIKALEREIEHGQMVVNYTKGEALESGDWEYTNTPTNTPTDTPTNDCISKQQVIEELQKYLTVDEVTESDEFSDGENSGIRMAIGVVDNLQPIEPTVSEDCISRAELLKDFGCSEKTRKYGGNHSGYGTYMLYEIQDIIEDAPSVTPTERTGRWVEDKYHRNICNNCGYVQGAFEPGSYCPNCGAKMKDGTENE